ncbi:Rsc58p NDAI_0E01820 [Naumovozyma dairenensis CBS 421]|uniref:Uncharacterized protein n=1 Tax=Naumovozyma dairenensis (strain ATCC 10597 / BCRC 20456 / CBS 421 / NBRC 0211 / NRRL Y-12639) TaxID=1071378 RepID=G0WB78_NAUDC|nr:hypothetical protein NDAI_0E01820 [Naumovozyma dairenensis CBS 421]CCD24998.1 hypothetical protein NDAI_0E01820 [Naumovozyma dairenensis CBS 421]
MSPDDLLADLQIVLKAASTKCDVLDEKFPSKFYEEIPAKIYESYFKFIKNRSNLEGVLRNEDKLALTTINEKFDNKEYIPEQHGIYKLYHDITLVCILLIHYYPQGTKNYYMVDKFYHFATELILRECYKLGMIIDANDDIDSTDTSTNTELDDVIGKDFIKVSMNYKLPLTQTYHIKTKDLDLFSSLISKSNLDKRPHELPNSNFEINNVIPQTNVQEEAPRLGFVAANTSNIPDPTLTPTTMLTNFSHPNWYNLPTTTWLNYDDYKSWAPTLKEDGTVVDSTTRGITWLKKVAYMNILKEKKIVEEKETSEEKLDKEETIIEPANTADTTVAAAITKTTNTPGTADAIETPTNTVNTPNITGSTNNTTTITTDTTTINARKMEGDMGAGAGSETKMLDMTEVNGTKPTPDGIVADNAADKETSGKSGKSKVIKLENLFNWSPSNYLGQDEIESFKNGRQEKLVNETLLKIQNLRKKRVSNRVTKPTEEETQLYHKAKRLMKEIILAKQVSDFFPSLCKSFPIVQATYSGNIPVIRAQHARKRRHRK